MSRKDGRDGGEKVHLKGENSVATGAGWAISLVLRPKKQTYYLYGLTFQHLWLVFS